MEVLQCCRDFSGVKASILLRYALARPCLKSPEELAATAILHAEVKVVFGLEGMI